MNMISFFVSNFDNREPSLSTLSWISLGLLELSVEFKELSKQISSFIKPQHNFWIN